eukprot:NODE_483_length_7824_cov_0.163625.p2 type:complete len:402 gc:universal NODE_483_length_7824_cov_0.163625:6522-5317(-)
MHPFLTLIESQVDLNDLYKDKYACLGMLRLLTQKDQLEILHLLFLNKPVKRKTNVFLKRLKIIHSDQLVELNQTFKSNLREMILCPELMQPEKTSTVANEHAQEKLNEILQSLVRSSTTSMKKSILKIMRQAQLFSIDSITNKGFQFLLQSTTNQYWTILSVYLELVKTEIHLQILPVVQFIFHLTLLQVSKGYNLSKMNQTQKVILDDFSTFGLCYIEDGYFYPTQFTACLVKEIAHTSINSRFIIVETNFKIYAYSTSELQKSILKLFITVKTIFKNMITGQLTRDSVKTALDCGITADQIIDYLQTHCHELMQNELPVNIKDQLHLWENERDRIKDSNGYLYSDFATLQLFQSTLNYAHKLDMLLWSSESDRYMFIDENGHDDMKAFITAEQNRLTRL